jgi:HD-like signal output (HDOD) protein
MSLEIFVIVIIIITSLLWYLKRGKGNRRISRTQNIVAKRSQSPAANIRSISSPIQVPVRLIPEANSGINNLANNSNDFLNFTLLPFDILNRKQQQKINEMSQCCRQPNPLLLSLTKSELEAKELITLIKSDAEMTAKILNTVNSSLFSLQQPIESIHHAIVFMGATAVRNIAIQFILQQSLSFKDEAQAAAYKKIWVSSYLASSLVFLLAKHLDKENAAELSTLCLLMSLGDMTMLSYKPSIASSYLSQTSLFERVQNEQISLDVNSSVIGKALAEQWQLPKSIVEGIGSSLIPLVNDKLISVMPLEEAQNTLLCYLSCRLGDLIAFGGVRDIFQGESNGIDALSSVDFMYVQTNIEQLGLEKISQLFQDPSFVNKAKRLIAQIGA